MTKDRWLEAKDLLVAQAESRAVPEAAPDQRPSPNKEPI